MALVSKYENAGGQHQQLAARGRGPRPAPPVTGVCCICRSGPWRPGCGGPSARAGQSVAYPWPETERFFNLCLRDFLNKDSGISSIKN